MARYQTVRNWSLLDGMSLKVPHVLYYFKFNVLRGQTEESIRIPVLHPQLSNDSYGLIFSLFICEPFFVIFHSMLLWLLERCSVRYDIFILYLKFIWENKFIQNLLISIIFIIVKIYLILYHLSRFVARILHNKTHCYGKSMFTVNTYILNWSWSCKIWY